MNFNELVLGTRLEMELYADKNGKVVRNYVSQLLEPVKDNRFVISAPIFEARLVFVPTGASVRIVFYSRKYGLLGFMSTVKSRETRGNIAVMIMTVAGPVEKIQRRTYFRLECVFSIQYRQHVEDNGEKKPAEPYKNAIVKNISGSGICMVCEENIPRNAGLDLIVDLGTGLIKATCTVMRSSMLEVNRSKKYELGLHYTDISPKDRDAIIKYVFEQQRLLLKKEVSSK